MPCDHRSILQRGILFKALRDCGVTGRDCGKLPHACKETGGARAEKPCGCHSGRSRPRRQEVSADLSKEPETYSKHIICIERTTNEVLYEKDAYSKTPMASTTKIMTAIIVLENCDLSENVKISTKAANTGGSTLGITAGSTISLESLMYGLLLRSRK